MGIRVVDYICSFKEQFCSLLRSMQFLSGVAEVTCGNVPFMC